VRVLDRVNGWVISEMMAFSGYVDEILDCFRNENRLKVVCPKWEIDEKAFLGERWDQK
jgi:hypothetical protein